MKNILLTGNLGYVGPVVEKYLLGSEGFTIYGLDTGWFEFDWFGNEYKDARVKQINMDVRDVTSEDLAEIDAIVHLAAVSNDPIGKEFERATYDINVDASVNLATLAASSGVDSFVFASSCSVYGVAGDEAKREDHELQPLTAYAKSKILFEEKLSDICRDGDMKGTALRFATACGVSPRLRLDLVLNDFVVSAYQDGSITILSDGTPIRPLIDVKDMAKAVGWAIDRGQETDEEFIAVNVGRRDNSMSVKQLAESVSEAIGGVEISINSDAPADKRSYSVDFSRFEELAPYHQPSYSIGETAVELANYLPAAGVDLTNFRSSNYFRLNKLRQLKDNGRLDGDLRMTL